MTLDLIILLGFSKSHFTATFKHKAAMQYLSYTHNLEKLSKKLQTNDVLNNNKNKCLRGA